MQRTLTRKAVAGVGILAVAVAAVGCTPSSDEDDSAFVVFAPQNADTDLATNDFTTAMSEKFDLDFSWQTTTFDGAAAAEQRQISLASGDYPDAYFLISWVDAFSQSEVLKYGEQGVLVPLEDLIEEHAPNIVAAMDEQPEWAKAMTSPDGHIYGISPWDDCYHCNYPSKLWMNTSWLEALGLEEPTTTEELRTVLRAFKTGDPNGNGQADEVPLSGSASDSVIPYLMNAFTYVPMTGPGRPGPLVLDDGQVAMQATTDEWRDGLSYIRSLAAEGLIDSAVFSQNSEALKSLGDNAGAELLGSVTAAHPGVFVSINTDDKRDVHYNPIPPLTGPEGVNTTTQQSSVNPKTTFALTNKSTEDERVKAIKMLDYIFSYEGTLAGEFGPEGVGWDAPKEGDVAIDRDLEPNFLQLQYDDKDNAAWRTLAQYWNPIEFRNAQVAPTDQYAEGGYEVRLFNATELYTPHAPSEDVLFPYYTLWPSAEQSQELADLQTNITTFITQSNAEFVTGQRDIDDEGAWSSYLDELDALGLERYLEIWQSMYDEQG